VTRHYHINEIYRRELNACLHVVYVTVSLCAVSSTAKPGEIFSDDLMRRAHNVMQWRSQTRCAPPSGKYVD